ncbi:hypothetical protein Ddye_031024 [Dipteronia dyeriana]|uniref:TOD1/MUCI70 glycosyltransferase-like domain-containing protein n=1 Tax=Dipteronia dyeriana TaxID=168575 RepID=A0AAD9THJ9_9ROSI|nr:hypothetical protein Ddye_031024 [Dipteronia dyeriana]
MISCFNINRNSLNSQESSNVIEVPQQESSNVVKAPEYPPCKVDFLESVNYLVEPKDYMNFSQLSLEYIDDEDVSFGTNVYKPRFGGHQTLQEREKSFYARNQTLHCGFVNAPLGFPSTGFDLDEKDKTFMSTCKVAVSTCIFGSSDFLRRPAKKWISDFSRENVCFVMFVDEETLSTLSSDGNNPDDEGYIGLWRIVIVRNRPYVDMRKNGKVPKFLAHRLYPSSWYSIWIDSKVQLLVDPMLIIEYVLWRNRSEYAISNHYVRHCVWEEAARNKVLKKYNATAINELLTFYQSDGLTKFDPSNPNNLLASYVPEASLIIRAHTPMSNFFSCLWFNEVDRFTSRDQLSFAYTYLKMKRMNPNIPFYFNMFQDCERRSMIKLLGHRSPPAMSR